MASKNGKGKHHGIVWWLIISWWWLPIKWVCYTIPSWIVRTFSQNATNVSPSTSHSAVAPKVLQKSNQDLDIVIPSRKDDAPLVYDYRVKLSITDEACLRKHHEAKDWSFTPKDINGEIHLFMGDDDIGTLIERTDMLRDWIQRGDPYTLYFENLSEENGAYGHIAFYRDKRKGNEWREQTLVALVSYKSKERQDIIEYLHEGDEVELEEEFDEGNETVNVTSNGHIIGKLPKKYKSRFIEEGVHSAFIEKLEYDDGGSTVDFKIKPIIRIYWTKRASTPTA